MNSLIDPKLNETRRTYDVEGRLTSKTYADNSTVTYTYENTTSRLASVLDALGQTKQYGYAGDNRVTGVTYVNAVNPTPNVTFAYDPWFPRLVSMTDGTGTTQYAYVPVGTPGALRLQQQSGPLANSAVDLAYDALGRVASRTVAGAGAETFGYDMIGRLASDSNDLGPFALSYLGQTGQITGRQLAGSALDTTWSYLPNAQDRRLAGIDNVGLSSGQYSNYAFTSTPYFITDITETSDQASAYPTTLAQTASYNNLNQLTDLSGQALTFDANGNLLSDGQRDYTWDAENRLTGITYPGQPGKQTTFTYNGLGQRVAIASTPAGGGSPVTTSYIWCGSRPCQARDATNSPTREYLAEGEFVPGSPGQPYYYGVDQIGSVRRVFASTDNAPDYDYDPYGNPLQTTAPLTDFGYAGMFYNPDSSLYLTLFRPYDPVTGRWLSRDPMGEMTDPAVSLYAYAGGDPVMYGDMLGLWTVQIGWSGTGTSPSGLSGVWFGGIAFDSQGNIGFYSGAGAGSGIGAGAALGGSFQFSNAPTICNLSGPFVSGSRGGGWGENTTGDVFTGAGGIIGGGVTVGEGFGATSFVGVTNTIVTPF